MKAAIYCRLSEEDRDKQFKEEESGSIQNQKALLVNYAMEQGWEIYNIYSDDDYAGADRNRPEFNRLINDAEQKKYDIILCKTQSRFTRELELVEKYIHGLFPLWGIRFVSVADNADTNNKGNKKSRQINGLVNEWYIEDMSENIRAVLNNRRQNGFHIGSFALYGYKKDPDNKGCLIIDEDAAKVVREVFELFADGYGKTAVARILNDKGIPNPTEYKRIKGFKYKQPKTKNATLWRYSAISNMLTNEIYIGNMVQGKYGSESYKTKKNKPRPRSEWYVVKHTHEAIISQDLWDKVQSLIEQRAKPFGNGRVSLFAGKVRCINCGYALSASKSHGKRYLKCPNRLVAKDSCVGAFISAEKLEQKVVAELNRLTQKYLDKNELEQNIDICSDFKKAKMSIQNDILLYEKKLGELEKGVAMMYMDRVRGIISESEFVNLSGELKAEKERLESVVSDAREQMCAAEVEIQNEDNRKLLIERYTNVEQINRQMVEVMIDCIFVGKRISGTQDVPVEIHWNF